MKPTQTPEERITVAANPLQEEGHARLRALVHRRFAGQRGRRLRQLTARRERTPGNRR